MQANTSLKLISGCLWAKAVECAVLFVSETSHCLAICVVETFGKQPLVSNALGCPPSLPPTTSAEISLSGNLLLHSGALLRPGSPTSQPRLNEWRKDPMCMPPTCSPSRELQGPELRWARDP